MRRLFAMQITQLPGLSLALSNVCTRLSLDAIAWCAKMMLLFFRTLCNVSISCVRSTLDRFRWRKTDTRLFSGFLSRLQVSQPLFGGDVWRLAGDCFRTLGGKIPLRSSRACVDLRQLSAGLSIDDWGIGLVAA